MDPICDYARYVGDRSRKQANSVRASVGEDAALERTDFVGTGKAGSEWGGR